MCPWAGHGRRSRGGGALLRYQCTRAELRPGCVAGRPGPHADARQPACLAGACARTPRTRARADAAPGLHRSGDRSARQPSRCTPRDAGNALPGAAFHDSPAATDQSGGHGSAAHLARPRTADSAGSRGAAHGERVAGSQRCGQAAAVVLDNRSGEVLAWVGSPDFFADTAGQVDMVVSPRQPGSALKPFLYGLAFDHGFTAAIRAARCAAHVFNQHGPIPAAELRSSLPRARARPRGTGQLVQRARSGAGGAHGCERVAAHVARCRLCFAHAQRGALRARPRAGQRRCHAARAGQCLSRTRQWRRVAALERIG